MMVVTDITGISADNNTVHTFDNSVNHYFNSLNVALHDQLSKVYEMKMSNQNYGSENQFQKLSVGVVVEGTYNVATAAAITENASTTTTSSPSEDHHEGIHPIQGTRDDSLVETHATDNNDNGVVNDVESNNIEDKEEPTSTASSSELRDGPLAIIRKGAVAAVGGTMVGVGLVMIPLPTPFGAVIASSGLAVLGTEFKEAKEMNERLIDGAKSTVQMARDRIVKSIESMDVEDFDPDEDMNKVTYASHSHEKDVVASDCGVIKIRLRENQTESDRYEQEEITETPLWLHMNQIERHRQERMAKEKHRKESQTTYEQTVEYFTKVTGSFLSRNVLPLLKDTKEERETGLDKNTSTLSAVEEEIEKNTCADALQETDFNFGGYVLVEGDDEDDAESADVEPQTTTS